jgi:hypothetical protein
MWPLLGRLIGWAAARLGTAVSGTNAIRTLIGVGIGEGGYITIEKLREQAALHAGNTGGQGLEEAARAAARMLGLGGDQVLWPVNRRTGQLIPPIYFTIDLVRGRAWYHSSLHKRRRFGGFGGYGRRGFRRWRGSGSAATINNNAC